jgi:hypothetical protein
MTERPSALFSLRSLLAIVLVIVSGCDGTPLAPAFHLAMVDYWPEQQLLFVASRHSGTVDVLHFQDGSTQASPEHVERLEHPWRRAVIRLIVDRKRGRVWIADHAMVFVYPFAPRGAETVITIPRERFEDRIHDLSLDDKGNGYVHTRGGSLIYRVDATTLGAESWLQPFGSVPDSGFRSTNRVLHSPDQRYLLFQAPRDGTLLRINIASGDMTTLRLTEPIDLRCGLLFWAAPWQEHVTAKVGDTVKAIDCLGRWTAEIRLSPEMTHATAALIAPRPSWKQ